MSDKYDRQVTAIRRARGALGLGLRQVAGDMARISRGRVQCSYEWVRRAEMGQAPMDEATESALLCVLGLDDPDVRRVFLRATDAMEAARAAAMVGVPCDNGEAAE
jgi:hypothetical protein